MPLSVVPILSSPRIASAIASCAWCHGKIRWARLDTFSSAHEIPRASSVSTSLNSVGRSTTTPLAITGITWSYRIPDGHELQGVLLAVDDHGVAGVVAALVAHDVGVLLRQQVDDLGFALIAPLGSDDDGDGHARSPIGDWNVWRWYSVPTPPTQSVTSGVRPQM